MENKGAPRTHTCLTYSDLVSDVLGRDLKQLHETRDPSRKLRSLENGKRNKKEGR